MPTTARSKSGHPQSPHAAPFTATSLTRATSTSESWATCTSLERTIPVPIGNDAMNAPIAACHQRTSVGRRLRPKHDVRRHQLRLDHTVGSSHRPHCFDRRARPAGSMHRSGTPLPSSTTTVKCPARNTPAVSTSSTITNCNPCCTDWIANIDSLLGRPRPAIDKPAKPNPECQIRLRI